MYQPPNISSNPKPSRKRKLSPPQSSFSRVSVMLRLRPPRIPTTKHLETALDGLQANGNRIVFRDLKGAQRQYEYDEVFGWDATQEEVFDACGVGNMLDRVLRDGLKASVFAYGQTGSGKTTTTIGVDQNAKRHGVRFKGGTDGIIPRAARYVFSKKAMLERELARRGATVHVRIRASFLEIYNETCTDLLNIREGHNLPVRYNDHQGFYVENLFIIECDTLDDLHAVIEEGVKNRKVAEHELNSDSSRSHAIFTIYTEIETEIRGFSSVKTGKMNIIDLSGSEKLKKSKSAKHHRTETRYINKSLLTLGQVISDLSKGKERHIRYRDSKLTSLLSDSLGGTSLCTMIATITPTVQQIEETLNTLNYANKAKQIQNKPQPPDEETHDDLIVELQQEIHRLKEENQSLKRTQPPKGIPSSHTREAPSFSQRRENMRRPRRQCSPQPSEPASPISGSSHSHTKGLSLKNPLHPNTGIRSLPGRLKPLNTRPALPRSPKPPSEQAEGSPAQTKISSGSLTDRSDTSDTQSGVFYPINAKYGRLLAERNKMHDEIQLLKSRLEKSRGNSAPHSLTPRRDLVTHQPPSESKSSESPVKRRFKEMNQKDADEISALREENQRLRDLLTKHAIPFDESTNVDRGYEPLSIAPKKPKTLQRPKKPNNVSSPQLPVLGSSTQATPGKSSLEEHISKENHQSIESHVEESNEGDIDRSPNDSRSFSDGALSGEISEHGFVSAPDNSTKGSESNDTSEPNLSETGSSHGQFGEKNPEDTPASVENNYSAVDMPAHEQDNADTKDIEADNNPADAPQKESIQDEDNISDAAQQPPVEEQVSLEKQDAEMNLEADEESASNEDGSNHETDNHTSNERESKQEILSENEDSSTTEEVPENQNKESHPSTVESKDSKPNSQDEIHDGNTGSIDERYSEDQHDTRNHDAMKESGESTDDRSDEKNEINKENMEVSENDEQSDQLASQQDENSDASPEKSPSEDRDPQSSPEDEANNEHTNNEISQQEQDNASETTSKQDQVSDTSQQDAGDESSESASQGHQEPPTENEENAESEEKDSHGNNNTCNQSNEESNSSNDDKE